jgi:hypothetical protein
LGVRLGTDRFEALELLHRLVKLDLLSIVEKGERYQPGKLPKATVYRLLAHDAQPLEHFFRLDCSSGNQVEVTLLIPRRGTSTPYELVWHHRATNRDRLDCARWRETVLADISKLAGHELHFADHDCEPVSA